MTPQETLLLKLPDFDKSWPAETQQAWLHSFGELTSLMRSEDKSQMWARARELFDQGLKARAAWKQLVVEFGDVVPRHPTSLYDRWKYWEQQKDGEVSKGAPAIVEPVVEKLICDRIDRLREIDERAPKGKPKWVEELENPPKPAPPKKEKPRITLADISGSKNLPKKMRTRIEELINQSGNFSVVCSKIRTEFGDSAPSEATLYGWVRMLTTKRGPRPRKASPRPATIKPYPPRKVQVAEHLPQKAETFDWSSVNTVTDLKKSSACRRGGLPNIWLGACLKWQADLRIKEVGDTSGIRLRLCLECPNWIRDKAVLQDLAEKFDILEGE